MNKDKSGKYWDDTLNMARHVDCHCECGDKCWWKQQQKRFKQPLGWFPEQAKKVSVTGKAKVFAVQWLGDIAFLEESQIATIVTNCHRVNTQRHFKALSPHTFLFLTKFPERLNAPPFKYSIEQEDNLWLGISASDQKTFNTRIKGLLKFDGFKKWVSLEPLQGTIDLENGIMPTWHYAKYMKVIDQVIVGGLTGGKYNANLDWYRSIRDRCDAAGVPFFIKHIDKNNGRKLDDREHNNLIWRKK